MYGIIHQNEKGQCQPISTQPAVQSRDTIGPIAGGPIKDSFYMLAGNYAIVTPCPPVRGDNPRALASGLSYVQVDKHQCKPTSV